MEGEITVTSTEYSVSDQDLVEATPVTVTNEPVHTTRAFAIDVERMQQRASIKQEQERHCKKVGFVIVVCSLAFLVGAILIHTQAINQELTAQLRASPVPTIAPSVAPSPSSPDYRGDFRASLPNYTMVSLDDPDSPQSMAYHWLNDHRNISRMEGWKKTQLFVLVTFFYTFDGPNWGHGLNHDWLDDTKDECLWWSSLYGYFNSLGEYKEEVLAEPCNANGEFQSLVLLSGGSHCVHGGIQFPPEISLLTALQHVELLSDNLHNATVADVMPLELLKLPNLEFLGLQGHNLVGCIPTEIGLATNLLHLGLQSSTITGKIPSEVGFLTKLTSLKFSGNHRSTKSIPSELGLLSDLVELDLADGSLYGTLPTELGSLATKSLVQVDITGNPLLKGPIPPELCGLNGADDRPCRSSSNATTDHDDYCPFLFDCTPRLCGCDCECDF